MATKEQLLNAMKYANQNPNTTFAYELKKRIASGEYNSLLSKEGISVEQPKREGKVKRFFKGLVKSELEFGESLAGAIDTFTGIANNKYEEAQATNTKTVGELMKAIHDKRRKGENTDKLMVLLQEISGEAGNTRNELMERQASLSTRQVLGQAGGVLTDVVGAGTIGGKTASVVKQPTTFFKGGLKGTATGALTGSTFGTAQGVSRGMQEDLKGSDLAISGFTGGVVGGVAGGVLGGALGSTSGYLRGRAMRKQQLLKELTESPELMAKYRMDASGKIVKDPIAKNAIKQGIPEHQVAVARNANPVDRSKFREMFGLAESAKKNAKQVARPSDIVGDTITTRTSHLQRQLKISGQQVDEAAQALKGQRVDPRQAVQGFIDDLGGMNVKFKNGKPIFDGSDIEGAVGAENLIRKITKRMENVSDDALELHRLKRYIDEQVAYGKQSEGLTGTAEMVVKQLRKNVDDLLDNNFTAYNQANQGYSKTRDLMDFTQEIFGKKFDVRTGNVRAGSVARKVLGNSTNRGDILEYIKALDDFYKGTGGKGNDDILSQVVFADILEDIFGTQATTGLQGQMQRAVEQAGGVLQDVAQGQPLAALTRGAVRTFQHTRGISPEAKIEALKKLIGL